MSELHDSYLKVSELMFLSPLSLYQIHTVGESSMHHCPSQKGKRILSQKYWVKELAQKFFD